MLHSLLGLMDPPKRLETLVQQESRVVHQHINEFDKLLAGLELLNDRFAVNGALPQTL